MTGFVPVGGEPGFKSGPLRQAQGLGGSGALGLVVGWGWCSVIVLANRLSSWIGRGSSEGSCMHMYWVYDVPNWLFGILTVLVFVVLGVVGLYLTRGWIRRIHADDHAHNDIVGFYMAGVTVLYAVSVGLLAIGAWATYADVQGKVDHEAAVLGGLYRDVSMYPEPDRGIMQDDLRRYARQVIDVGWPLQRKGIVLNDEGAILTDFQTHFMAFEPQNERQKILAAEAYRTFNDLTEAGGCG